MKVLRSSTLVFYFHFFRNRIPTHFPNPSDNESSNTEANSKNRCIDPEQPPVRTPIYGTPHFDNRLSCKAIGDQYIDIFNDEIDLLSPFSWEGGVSISTLVCQAQHVQSCNQRAFQELYDGNRQQLHFFPHMIDNIARNVLCDGHRLVGVCQCLFQFFASSKQPSQWWLHTFLLLQSCWIHWVPHETACVQGTYVVCPSKGIQWCRGMYQLRGEIKRWVVEWTCTFVEFRHCYDEFDHFNCHGGRLEPQLSVDSAVHSRHILQTIRVTRSNWQYIWVSETSSPRLDQILRMLQSSLMPFFLFLKNITSKEKEKPMPWGKNNSTIVRFQGGSSSWYFVLWMRFSQRDSVYFVRTAWCGNVILSSAHGRPTTLKTFTCTPSCSPIVLCVKHRNCCLENGIHHRGSWERIG